MGNPVVCFEPTGDYHKPLPHWLIQRNYLVVLVAGKAVKDNRELLDGRWDKNDTKDSANAADLVSQGKCQFYEQPNNVLIAVHNLIIVRKQLKKEENKLLMREKTTGSPIKGQVKRKNTSPTKKKK